MYTLAQAAKATGLTKAAIQKSIKKGRISAQRNDFGHYSIDPAELHRVYPVVDNRAVESEREETAVHRRVITSEQVRIKELETQLAMKDQLFGMKDQLLEQVKEERDYWRQQATSLLESRKESWLTKLLGRKA